jgi:hypothetical protein
MSISEYADLQHFVLRTCPYYAFLLNLPSDSEFLCYSWKKKYNDYPILEKEPIYQGKAIVSRNKIPLVLVPFYIKEQDKYIFGSLIT